MLMALSAVGKLDKSEELILVLSTDSSKAGPEVVKLFSRSTQLSMNFFLLINVKMATILLAF